MTSSTIGELYARFAPELVRFAGSVVDPASGPDVVADVFVEILRSKPLIKEPRAFLYRSVYNRSISHLRRVGREVQRCSFPELENLSTPLEDSDRWLEPYLKTLSEQQRAILYLRYVEDMTPDAISTVLSVSEGSTKRQLARIHSKLAATGATG